MSLYCRKAYFIPYAKVPGIDYQHAVIEYSEQEDCLIIQDLNTAQGTYVNDVRIQNAAVRLAPGDCIRFGYNGSPYELQLEQTQMVSFSMICVVNRKLIHHINLGY